MGSLIDLLLFSLLLGTCTCNEGATRRGCLCNLGWSGDRCSSTYWNFCIRRKIRSCTVFVHSACIDRRDRFEDYYDRLMTAFGSGADCLFLAPFCHCLACVIVYFPSSNHINCICQLLIANPALSLSILAGMRIGEIAALKISDVRGIDGKAVEVINLSKHQTKGNRSRRVFISDELRKIVNQYLAQISQLDDSKAFIRSSRTMDHFSNISLSLRFKAIYASAGIRTSSHSGRRTFATRLNAAGIGMATIQQAMGHANIATTAGYCYTVTETVVSCVSDTHHSFDFVFSKDFRFCHFTYLSLTFTMREI